MALGMLWAGQAKKILGGWGIVCLLVSLLLQYPGVHSKCYFQAQGKVGSGVRKGRGSGQGLRVTLGQNIQIPSSHEIGNTTYGD
jgi:hypothetical protein